ncbi:CopG family transcriptional regulator [Pseudoduganella violacea]|uniref:Putative transcriptional regulator n=1 Tax=Pseudoduganella violacea TaxID=1715466 RepID=A0A7W5B6Y2_9BURK|nr:CopG family transcriptional regulator [Pseudoduganella violacea]MBB3117661.1 putative transcriptional regulator [Pseudoduganella violacea]
MTNTTIQLSAELQAAITKAAERAGITEHDYVLAAISEKLIWDSPDPDVHDEAERRWQQFLQTGMAIPHEEVIEYWERRLAGEQVPRPVARKIKA